ncbi:hypothetical protein [Salmonella enterica]|uniref:hypothetical protein n=1 Tax=Salmonella enterica TaxID=28901 RepID=UPI0021B1BB34|nr:hypothetical protein [Salmonella enterica]MCT7173552.1 hypothetical protein [Salmonella enterica subsp. enterica serovar Anatum]
MGHVFPGGYVKVIFSARSKHPVILIILDFFDTRFPLQPPDYYSAFISTAFKLTSESFLFSTEAFQNCTDIAEVCGQIT